ncbi:hypothetical protein BS50DRAFT_592723 [Corynespora cassiicola Philippines]|uniref:Uncharacterized protein n=1 Tax=Corynespora cassiicola Philippines TaxID=1448308 RepID=A0A2T2N8N0_CORCC|nr:hypothetical protein BS50DRAFT_592723 [Corynespora cassiicola Philippines]
MAQTMTQYEYCTEQPLRCQCLSNKKPGISDSVFRAGKVVSQGMLAIGAATTPIAMVSDPTQAASLFTASIAAVGAVGQISTFACEKGYKSVKKMKKKIDNRNKICAVCHRPL